MERYVYSGGKRLRCGYTTGACAAAAAKAAARALLTGEEQSAVAIGTPKGAVLDLLVEDTALGVYPDRTGGGTQYASCAVRKDAGDDADITDGILVYARAEYADGREISIDGGRGVGRVTRPGLDQPVGAAAINRGPRQMIEKEVRKALDALGCREGLRITIEIPEGETLAARTYNPRLGIEGGLSVLGTTGIVEPMSEAALVDTIRVELEMLRAQGPAPVLMTPGNYGETFARETLGLSLTRSVLCSNYIGEALDHAARLGFEGLLLVGHIGKLVKLAGGIYQTHSRVADARMEILAAHAAVAGAGPALARALLDCNTTDSALDLLDGAGLLGPVMETLTAKLCGHLRRRAGAVPAEVVLFSNARGMLAQSAGAGALMKRIGMECMIPIERNEQE